MDPHIEDGQIVINGCFSDQFIEKKLAQFYFYIYYTEIKTDMSNNE